MRTNMACSCVVFRAATSKTFIIDLSADYFNNNHFIL